MSAKDSYVLIVEDDLDIGEALEMILQSRGYQCAVVRDGVEALEKLRLDPLPSVVLLDMMMPVMNGAAFRAAQLEDARIASLPIVVMTADSKADERAKELGVERYLRKPVSIDELLEVVALAGG